MTTQQKHQWHYDLQVKLEKAGAAAIEVARKRENSAFGRYMGKQWTATWHGDEILMVGFPPGECGNLIDAFSAVFRYAPFCRYTHADGLVTVEWDKLNAEGRYAELRRLEGGAIRRLVRL